MPITVQASLLPLSWKEMRANAVYMCNTSKTLMATPGAWPIHYLHITCVLTQSDILRIQTITIDSR
jgi:hypothetical protein